MTIESFHQRLGQLLRGAPVDEGAAARSVGFQQHVVNHPHRSDQPHAEPVLGDKAHAHPEPDNLGGRFPDEVFLVIEDRAFIRQGQAGDRLTQLLLTRPGDPGHPENLPGADLKGNIV